VARVECRAAGKGEKRGRGLLGVIIREEYVCDFCGKSITDVDMLVGKLALRKQGARGLGREVSLALHPACSEKLTENAPGATGARQRRVEATVKPEPEVPTKSKENAPTARRRRRSSSSTEAS
jgi:hypothetical protein